MEMRACARLCAVAVVLTATALSRGAVVLSDNFDDGNDDGWSRLDANGDRHNEGFGGYTDFDAGTGAYRIRAFPGPTLQSPSRALAYRAGQSYGDFQVS